MKKTATYFLDKEVQVAARAAESARAVQRANTNCITNTGEAEIWLNEATEARATVVRLAEALTVYVNSAPTDTLTQRVVRAEALAALAAFRGEA